MATQILIFAPTEAEAAALEGIDIDGAVIRTVVCGVGMAETAASVAAEAGRATGQQFFLLAGIAGAYPGMGLSAGDCVAVTSEKAGDLGAVRSGQFTPLYQKEYGCPFAFTSLPKARSLTVSCIGGPHEAEAHTGGYHIENMEGAAFFAICTALGIPFVEVRAVSNFTSDRRESWRIPEALDALRDGVRKIVAELLISGKI